MILDTFAFCGSSASGGGEIGGGQHLAGRFGVGELVRLRAELASGDGFIAWQLAGGIHSGVAGGCPQLSLSVSGVVKLVCQRCMTPFEYTIDSHTDLLLAEDETAADGIEALLEDDELEVIVGSRAMDVMSLVEDEALLALPLAPRHEVCPDTATNPDSLDALVRAVPAKRPSPFAALKDLKEQLHNSHLSDADQDAKGGGGGSER